MSKVSIILPAFNAESTVSHAIASVVEQTCREWELIVIDDGSCDKTGRIARNFAHLDSRIRVMRQPNSGVSKARNLGLKAASGEYVAFLDADDLLEPGFVAANRQCDFTICGYLMGDGNVFLPESTDIDEMARVPYYLDTCWGKFFKKSIIDTYRLQFDVNLRLSEDTVFCYEYLRHCSEVEAVHAALYDYSGEWGVAPGKMKINRKDFELLLHRNARAMRGINSTVDLNGRGFHLRHLAGLFTDYDLNDIYQMYANAYQDPCGVEAFLADYRVSPLNQVIDRLDEIDDEALSQYRKFFTVSPLKFFAKAGWKFWRRAVFYFMLKTCPLWVIKKLAK